MRVLVISGGDTSERPVSLRSAGEVVKALEQNGYSAQLFDLKDGYDKLDEIIPSFDVIFPKLHGKEGEDGKLYQFLKSSGKPYVGSDPQGAKEAFDKIISKQFFDQKRIPTSRWKVIKTLEDIRQFGFPCVLKAAEGGSSKEVALLKSEPDLDSTQVRIILSLPDRFYVESLLSGVEITVGVLKDQTLPIIEIRPPEGKWFDYQNKYSGESEEIIGAPSVNKKTQETAKDITLNLHRHFKLGPYSRTDFIVVDEIPYVLEVNTPCGVGFTPQSLYPKMAKAAGLDFPKLVKTLVEMASIWSYKRV